MTLMALWYRRQQNDIYAIADSRLTNSNGGVLTDHAPKFTIAHVNCYASTKGDSYDKMVINKTFGIGYTGSSSVAFATIVTLQGYLSSLCLPKGGTTPCLKDISVFCRQLLEEYFSNFGALWFDSARCDLVLFGSMPVDKELKAFHISTTLGINGIETILSELPIAEKTTVSCFGSGRKYFSEKLKTEIDEKIFDPLSLLKNIISKSERTDIGGSVQVAIANNKGVTLPFIADMRMDIGPYRADVSFLGRNTLEATRIGECTVGRFADGPPPQALLAMRKKAGY